MEENKQFFENNAPENGAQLPEPLPPEGQAEQAAAAPAEDAVPPAEGAPAVGQPVAPAVPLSFDFGAQRPEKKKSGIGAFFAVFGGVFALCIALLIVTLFLGDGGIQIVKTLHSERVIYVREDDGTSGLLTPNEAADVVKRSTVTVVSRSDAGSGIGSGFVYDANGHICTNYHVIEGATSVQVILPDGTAVDASVVGYDVPADLAVLKLEAAGLVPAVLGSSADLLVGDAVVAVGTPASIEFAGTATFGNVSATSRLLALEDASGTVYRKITVIQTDTSVNPGNSGGPMADMYGHVIGIVVRKILSYNGSAYEGVGFAIPINGAKVILDEIIAKGSFTGDNPVAEGRSLLGVTGYGGEGGKWYAVDGTTGSVTVSDTEQPGYVYMPRDGVFVSAVSGQNVIGKMQVGDVILAINGLRMTTIQDVIGAVNRHYAGESVTLTVWRGDAEITVRVMLTEGAAS